MVEVAFGEAIFGEEIFEVDIIIEWIGIGKIEECGDNLGQEKEIKKEEVDPHLVLDQDQKLVQIEIGSGVLNVKSMTTLLMNVQI